MPGLIDSTEGLCYKVGGLIFEPGLGGPGLDNGLAEIPQVVFAGSGNLRVSTIQRHQVQFAFAGAGALSLSTIQRHQVRATLAGSGALQVSAGLAVQISMRFAGSGGGIG